jgi:hypothetical protein
MSYGTIKVDTITFTDNSVDKSVSLSGLIQNPTFTGNITVTGTISGDVIRGGTTVSGATVTGTTANFVSGVFTTQISGATVTGTTASFTSGVFTNISGTTATITSGIIASGTAAAPSLAILADLDTGLFSPGANQLAVATNGTGRLFINSSGQVGVGATESSSTFGVHGTNAGGYVVSRINNTSATGFARLLFDINGGTNGTADISYVPGTFFAVGPSSNDTTTPIVFRNNNASERLRITSAGLVGIGTSSPGHILDVAGSTTTPIARIQSSSTGNNVLLSCQNLNGFAAGGGSRIRFGTLTQGVSAVEAGFDYDTASFQVTKNGSTLFTANSTGLGIGTTSPSTTLSIGASASSSYNGGVCLNRGPSTYNFYEASDGTNSVIFGLDNNLTVAKIGSVNSYPIGFFTGNNERARIDSSGRLLVGTSSARNKFFNTTYTPQLQLEGVGQQQSFFSLTNSVADNGGPVIGLAKQRSGSIGGNTIVNSGDSVGQIDFFGSDGTEMVALAEISAAVDGTPGANDMPGRLVFSTTADGASSPTERMRITSAGRVGIGTASPSAKLEVVGGNIRLDNNQGVEWGGVNNYIYGNESTDFIAVATNGNERSRWDSSGRLLVGTSSSLLSYANLQVTGGSDSAGHVCLANTSAAPVDGANIGSIRFTNSAGGIGAIFGCEADGAWTAGSNYRSRLVFATTADGASSPTERMKIIENGNVRIGRTNAYLGERLVVANTLNQRAASIVQDFNGTVPNVALFHTYARVGQSATQIEFQDFNGTTVGTITNNTAAVAYNTTSDYRLKENIAPVVDGITRLQQLKPSRFNFISDPSRIVDGFIAHEVQDIVHEAITGEKDAVDDDGNPVYQGIDQSKLVPLLTAALQEAIGEIESLKARLTAAGI